MNPEENNQSVLGPVPPTENHEIDNDKLWSILSYIPLFFIIVLIVMKNRSSFLNYHLNQGIILSLVVVAANFGLDLLPWWLKIVSLLIWALNLFSIALMVVGIKNVLEKKTEPLPVIGKLFTFLK